MIYSGSPFLAVAVKAILIVLMEGGSASRFAIIRALVLRNETMANNVVMMEMYVGTIVVTNLYQMGDFQDKKLDAHVVLTHF